MAQITVRIVTSTLECSHVSFISGTLKMMTMRELPPNICAEMVEVLNSLGDFKVMEVVFSDEAGEFLFETRGGESLLLGMLPRDMQSDVVGAFEALLKHLKATEGISSMPHVRGSEGFVCTLPSSAHVH